MIGILTAVAMLGYVRDAKAASAKAAIGVILNAEKLYYQRNEQFTNATPAQFEGLPEGNPLRVDVQDTTHYGTITVTGSDNNTFTVTNTGKAGADFDYSKIVLSLIYKPNGDEVWKKAENGVEF